MKYLFSIFFILGVLFSAINFGFGVEFQCCYSGTLVAPTVSGNCNGGNDIDLGIDDYDACIELGSLRLSCEKGGTNFCNAAGFRIYDNIQIKEKYSQLCDSFPEYKVSICEADSVIETPGVGGTPGGDDLVEVDPIVNTFSDDEINIFNTKCKDGGGFLGLFVNKDSCESIVLSGDNHCVFNPYLGGNINSFFPSAESIGVMSFERESCIVDKALKLCSDLKSENLCEGDSIDSLANDCRWVEPSEFVSNVNVLGMCVSKEISDTKYFNKQDYYSTNNIIKNPSFEITTGNYFWVLGGSTLSTASNSAYFGKNSIILGDSDILTQNILNLTTDLTYKLNFNMRSYTTNLTGELFVYFDGVKFSTSFNLASMSNSSYGNYKLKTIKFRPGVNRGDIRFEFIGLGSVQIDSVSLSIFDSLGPVDNSNEIFSPVNIIPTDASNCNLCFTDLGFNFCTQKKSDLLGACTYMTDGPNFPYGFGFDKQKYLGSDTSNFGNKLLLTEKRWESQSLSNSQLFCELYVNKNQCVDPGNYVNSEFSRYHGSSGGNLCKWSSSLGVGCYKDSNGDNAFDTIYNYPKGVDVPNNHPANEDIKFESDTYYQRDATSVSSLALGVSDFQVACDILPPNTHVSLTGRNVDGETVFIGLNDVSSDIIGDVHINVLAEDLILESCSDFNFVKKLYVEYELDNGEVFTETVSSNQYDVNSVKINEFLIDSLGDSLLIGATNLKVKIVDQSGNVGDIWDMDLNIDNVGPEIVLVSPDLRVDGLNLLDRIVSLGQSFNFSVTDDTIVDRCIYNLDGLGSDVDPLFYNSSGNISIIPSGDVSIDFKLPIFNSSSNGDAYQLIVTCFDIFNQNTTKALLFAIDIDTNIVLVSPVSFKDKIGFDGFLNNKTTVVLVSSDSKLSSCKLSDFTNVDSTLSNFIVSDYDPLIHDDLLGGLVFDDIKKVAIGEIGFSVDGKYNGNYSCTDLNANTFSEEHTYFYDTLKPKLLDFEIIGDNSLVFKDLAGNYYLRGTDTNNYNIEVNLTVDGTGTWINSGFSNLTYNNMDGTYGLLESAVFGDANLLNNSYVSSMMLRSSIDTLISPGTLVDGEHGLLEVNFQVSLFDKAENNDPNNFSYFYDSISPQLNFSGDIYDLNLNDGMIFSRIKDPNIVVSFSSPSYRQFTCDVELEKNGQRGLKKTYNSGNSFSFLISSIDTLDWFNKTLKVTVNVKCEDVYGEILEDDFDLIYDNTPLILNEVGLTKGDSIYSRISTNYNPFLDSIFFNFNDTSEVGGYYCSYRFNELDVNYDCLNNFTKLSKFTSLDYTTLVNSIMSGYSTSITSDIIEYHCTRTDYFKKNEANNLELETDLHTNFELEILCKDGSGFEVIDNVPLNYTYLTDGLISFDYEYVGLDKIIFTVKSFVDYSSVLISSNNDGSDELIDMTSSNLLLDGTFEYKSIDYSIEQFAELEMSLYAVAFDNGYLDGFISTSLFIDKTLPVGNFTVVDLNDDGEVFYDTFKLNINVTDEISGLDNINLFVDGNLIAEFNGIDYILYNETYDIKLSDFSGSSYLNGGKTFIISLLFGEAVLGTTYDFSLVTVDNVGRTLTNVVSVTYVDGLYLSLIDSVNAISFDDGFGWLTRVDAPILSFETSNIVTCSMTSNKGGHRINFDSGTIFSTNLVDKDRFNLSNLGDEVIFEIECINDIGTIYTFSKTLFLNLKLLDYVLILENGFLVNEEPHLINAQIKSVGPFSKMSCEYSYAGKIFTVELKGGVKDLILNFSTSSTGIFKLDLSCDDAIGNFGPDKSYDFNVEVGGPLVLDLDSVMLVSSDGYESRLDNSNELFIHQSTGGVTLSFNLNKKNIESCKYGIDPVDGFLPGVVNFIRSLFGVERYGMISSIPYQYSISGLSFDSPNSVLEILCFHESGSSFSENYNVNYVDNLVLIDAQRVSQ